MKVNIRNRIEKIVKEFILGAMQYFIRLAVNTASKVLILNFYFINLKIFFLKFLVLNKIIEEQKFEWVKAVSPARLDLGINFKK
jgi:hypothetical protein